jgi:hypothetical protein
MMNTKDTNRILPPGSGLTNEVYPASPGHLPLKSFSLSLHELRADALLANLDGAKAATMAIKAYK